MKELNEWRDWINEKKSFHKNKGAGILAWSKSTKKFLVGLRGSDCPAPNQWCGIGGKMDKGEIDPRETAIREFEEEAGFNGTFEELIPLGSRENDHGFRFFNYLGILKSQFKPDPDEEFADENSEFKWCTWQELKDLPRKHHGLKKLVTNKDVVKLIKDATK